MSEKDISLIEMAYETTYKSTVRKFINQAESDECKRVLTEYLNECSE